MHVKSVNKTKVIRRYMEALALHTGAPTVHLEYSRSYISVVGAKIVTPGVKHIYIPVCFILEQFENGIFVPKYEKSSVIMADICTKPCAGTIISRSTKYMNGFIFYPNSDT